MIWKKEIKVYLDKWYECYFVPVCDGWTDDDNRFFPEIKKRISINRNTKMEW